MKLATRIVLGILLLILGGLSACTISNYIKARTCYEILTSDKVGDAFKATFIQSGTCSIQ